MTIRMDEFKIWLFGSSVPPDILRDKLVKVLFWPDAFLLFSVLFSVSLVVAIALTSRTTTVLAIKSNVASVSAVYVVRFVCFLALVGASSATARMMLFIFGGSSGGDGNQAAVTVFSLIFLVPALLGVSLVAVCGMAMRFLLGLKLRT